MISLPFRLQMKAELNLPEDNSGGGGGHQFRVEATSALTGQGLQSGIEWLSRLIIDNMAKNKKDATLQLAGAIE